MGFSIGNVFRRWFRKPTVEESETPGELPLRPTEATFKTQPGAEPPLEPGEAAFKDPSTEPPLGGDERRG